MKYCSCSNFKKGVNDAHKDFSTKKWESEDINELINKAIEQEKEFNVSSWSISKVIYGENKFIFILTIFYNFTGIFKDFEASYI